MAIDRAWFQKRIAASRFGSQRQLALEMGMDPASLSLTLRGKRKLQLEEAEAIAKLLGIPLPEVLAHAGVRSLPRARDPYPSIPSDILDALARIPAGDPFWALIRAGLKSRR